MNQRTVSVDSQNARMKSIALFIVITIASDLCLAAQQSNGPNEGEKKQAMERIVGGQHTTIDSYPYQVSLRRGNATRMDHICGGSMIAMNRVLTAAHCLRVRHNPKIYSVLAGATNRTSANHIRNVAKYVRHPRYSARSHRNDIAVIILDRPYSFTETVIRAIALPQQDVRPPYAALATITGWGNRFPNSAPDFTSAVMFTQVPIITNYLCNQYYRGNITDEMICAGIHRGTRSVCLGDFGGPLIVDGVQHGVASWGRLCGRTGFPDVYARVAHYTDWIRSIS